MFTNRSRSFFFSFVGFIIYLYIFVHSSIKVMKILIVGIFRFDSDNRLRSDSS